MFIRRRWSSLSWGCNSNKNTHTVDFLGDQSTALAYAAESCLCIQSFEYFHSLSLWILLGHLYPANAFSITILEGVTTNCHTVMAYVKWGSSLEGCFQLQYCSCPERFLWRCAQLIQLPQIKGLSCVAKTTDLVIFGLYEWGFAQYRSQLRLLGFLWMHGCSDRNLWYKQMPAFDNYLNWIYCHR